MKNSINEKKMPLIFAMDTGGTFTDAFVVDKEGHFVIGKTPTTPHDEKIGFFNALNAAFSAWNLTPEEAFKTIEVGIYAGTTMINRVVERKGSKVGVIVTRGFEDYFLIERGAQTWMGLSFADALHIATHKHHEPLTPRTCIRGVRERIDKDGDEVIPLYESEAVAAVNDLLDQGVEYIVINLLFSYRNPSHEKRIAEIAAEVMKKRGKEIPVLPSSIHCPLFRDFPRLNTVFLEAYAAAPARKHLKAIQEELSKLGAKFKLGIMTSYGGSSSIEAIQLVRSLCSGLIGGVIGAKYLGDKLGIKNIIGFDIGGTSTDISVIIEGQYAFKSVPNIDYMLLNLPSVMLDTIGAGTGSFVRLSQISDRIEVGPDSASYRIGVANEEAGLTTPTINDCNLVLGYLNPYNFMGGKKILNKDRSYEFIKDQIASKMGIDPLDAALAAVTIFNDNCRNHIIATVTGRGYGTEDFALMSWGSGGPLHIGSISEGLTFTDLLIPKWAPAFSAFGGTCADFSYRRDLTVNLDIPSKSSAETKLNIAKKINSAWSTLKAEVMEEFTSAGVSSKKVKFHPYVKMKYLGQLNDVEVGSPSEKIRNEDDIETIEKRFEELYARIYTRAARSPELGFSVTSVFVLGIVDTIKPELMHEQIESKEPSDDAYKKGREIYYGNKWLKADVFDLEKLKPGNEIKGTALLEGPFTTILTLPKRKILLDTHMIFHVHQGEIGSA